MTKNHFDDARYATAIASALQAKQDIERYLRKVIEEPHNAEQVARAKSALRNMTWACNDLTGVTANG